MLEVHGMSCGHCEKAVKDAVKALQGVHQVEVHVKNNEVKLEYNHDMVHLELICEAIEAQGFNVVR